MNKSSHGLGSQSGQAIVEYILLLVVVITLVFALANRFFQPFQKWAQFYIGDYVECLLDQGELPALGGTNGIQDCEASKYFEDSGKNSSTGNGSKDSDKSGSENDREGNSRKRNSSNNDGGGGGGVRSTDGGRSFRRMRVGGTDGSGNNGKSIALSDDQTDSQSKAAYFRNTNPNVTRIEQGRAQRVMGFSGLIEAEKEKIKRREQKVQKAVAKVDGGGADAGKGKKSLVNTSGRKSASLELKDEPWSFGKLFRLLLIIVIVIALVLFISGQLVQISKGMEK